MIKLERLLKYYFAKWSRLDQLVHTPVALHPYTRVIFFIDGKLANMRSFLSISKKKQS